MRVKGLGLRAEGSGFRVQDFRFRVKGIGVGCRVHLRLGAIRGAVGREREDRVVVDLDTCCGLRVRGLGSRGVVRVESFGCLE